MTRAVKTVYHQNGIQYEKASDEQEDQFNATQNSKVSSGARTLGSGPMVDTAKIAKAFKGQQQPNEEMRTRINAFGVTWQNEFKALDDMLKKVTAKRNWALLTIEDLEKAYEEMKKYTRDVVSKSGNFREIDQTGNGLINQGEYGTWYQKNLKTAYSGEPPKLPERWTYILQLADRDRDFKLSYQEWMIFALRNGVQKGVQQVNFDRFGGALMRQDTYSLDHWYLFDKDVLEELQASEHFREYKLPRVPDYAMNVPGEKARTIVEALGITGEQDKSWIQQAVTNYQINKQPLLLQWPYLTFAEIAYAVKYLRNKYMENKVEPALRMFDNFDNNPRNGAVSMQEFLRAVEGRTLKIDNRIIVMDRKEATFQFSRCDKDSGVASQAPRSFAATPKALDPSEFVNVFLKDIRLEDELGVPLDVHLDNWFNYDKTGQDQLKAKYDALVGVEGRASSKS